MEIDGQIASVMFSGDHLLVRVRANDHLIVAAPYRHVPKAGQRIVVDDGACVVEAGFGGPRIKYERDGRTLREKS